MNDLVTESLQEVEAFCRNNGIRWEWKADGNLRTTQRCQAIETHPATGELVGFNQAHLFPVSNLQPEVRAVLDTETVSFKREQGDVTMLDNMLVAHARSPFKGPRKVVVAMAEPHGNLGKF